MPITEQMAKERRNWIGASDAGAILGLSRYQSPYDIWLQKTGQLEDSKISDAADAGNRFESGVLDDAEEKLGKLERNLHVKAAALSFPMASNLDARVVADGRPVEAKTAGLFGPLTADWDEDSLDGIPEFYHAQCQAHLLITDRDLCHVPAFLGGVGFRLFRIPRNEDFIKIIIDRCAAFWECVQSGNPPAFALPSYDVIRRVKRSPGKTISVPVELVAQWRAAKDLEKAAKERAEQTAAILLAAMKDAEIGECQIGTVTHKLIERDGYTVKPTSFRQLNFKSKPQLSLGESQ